MPRITIQQFRDALAGRSDQGISMRAYRELARRAGVPTGLHFGEWTVWPPAAAPTPAT